MSIKALADYTQYSKYAKYIKEKKRRETWEEQVERVFNMHRVKLGEENFKVIKDEFDFAKSMLLKKKILGSQRALQFGGDPILKKNSKIYNCCASYIDRPRFFQECQYLLLCGCGTGMSVQKHHVQKLPKIRHRDKGIKDFVIPDTIEGWADAIGLLMASYFNVNKPFYVYDLQMNIDDVSGYKINFDYSLIRPEGSIISWGGIAPGPEGLKSAIEKIEKLLDLILEKDGSRKLKPIEVYDIIMHMSDSVLSGGIRRCISKGSYVTTKHNSFTKIEDIKIGDMVSTNDGWKPVTNVFIQGVQKTIKIVHQDGHIRCTPNHKIAVLTSYLGDYKWKYAKDITENDVLMFPSNNTNTESKNELPSFEYEYPLHSTTCKKIEIPKLDEEIAWLLGEIHGDGYVYLSDSSGQISIAVEGNNKDKAIYIQNLLTRFGINPKLQLPTDIDNSYKIVVKSKQLATYFNSWLKKPKTTIDVPECIKYASDNIKIAYVQGVLDADGCIGKRCQQIVVSVYKDFVVQLQQLLYSTGIISRFKNASETSLQDNWKKKYALYLVNNCDRDKFNSMCNVGFKKFRESKSQRMSNSFPTEMLLLDNKLPKLYNKKVAKNSKNVPYSTLRQIRQDEIHTIKPVRVKNVIFDDKEVETFDIEVKDNHNFVCNGVLVHNSACITLFSPNDKEMATCKTGNWFIENPQRGRSNNSAILLRDETTKEQFSKLIKSVKEYGEPGFIWSENLETLYNPCITKDMMIMTSKGSIKVENLIGKKFTALVDGDLFDSTKEGFYYTGNKPVYEIKTKEGFMIKSTLNHKFLVLENNKKIWKELKDITIGDNIVIHNHNNFSWDGSGTFKEGWLLGSLYGDGNMSEVSNSAHLDYWGNSRFLMKEIAIEYINDSNLQTYHKLKGESQTTRVGKERIKSVGVFKLAKKYGISVKNKIIENNEIENASSEFYKGFLRGWFDAEGSVQETQQKGVSIRLSSVNEKELLIAQRMLLRLGIFSKFYRNRNPEGYKKLPDENGGLKKYWCKSIHELIISKDSIIKFKERVGFNEPEKTEKLNFLLSQYKRKISETNFVAKINSISYVSDEDVYDCTINDCHAFDANCFYVHNCSEISFNSYDDDGNSGWGFCNLTEINGKKAKTEEQFFESCEAASILGTIQAMYTDFDYLEKYTKNIVERDALLGVSITGMMDNPDIIFNDKIQRKGAKIVLETNEKIANKLGINSCARGTAIKPSGTASCILGTSSGIHPQHAKRYLRRIQSNNLEFPLKKFKEVNPLAVEDSVWSSNKTDSVISFICEVPDGSKTKNQLSAIEFLEHVKLTQQNWIEYGTRKNDERYEKFPWLRHNVSNTINVCDYEWDDVEKYIYKNRKYFAGISLISRDGDKDFPQAPFTTIYTPIEMVREYGNGVLMASGLIVDGLHAFENNLWSACDCVLGINVEIKDMEPMDEPEFPTKNGYTQKEWNKKLIEYTKKQTEYIDYMEEYEKNKLKKDWIRRVKQFADRYVDGDIRKCTYLLKDTHNWKLWCDLKREYKDIDWSSVEEINEQKIDVGKIAGAACSGGNCDLGELGESIKAKQEDKQKKN